MTTIASQITSFTIVYSTVYSDTDQRKHQSSASLAFVWGIHRDRWIPRTKSWLRGKCFHLMTSSCFWSMINLGHYFATHLCHWYNGLSLLERLCNWLNCVILHWFEMSYLIAVCCNIHHLFFLPVNIITMTLHGRRGVSNHQPLDCLLTTWKAFSRDDDITIICGLISVATTPRWSATWTL